VHLHVSEVEVPHLLAEVDLGVDIINCGPAADMTEVVPALKGRRCFSGNLDPIEVLMRGTPADIEREVQRITATCSGGGWLFNTGEMNPRDVPVANMKAMVKAVRAAHG
jgi:uroporphyrinogen-III decarboxylase